MEEQKQELEEDDPLAGIVVYPDPILVKSSSEVATFNPWIVTIRDRMTKVMNAAKGIGIAAPQIGVSLRLICWNVPKGGEGYLVNPVVTWRSDQEQVNREGCLSFPGLSVEVTRPKTIKVSGFTVEGNKVEEFEVSDLTAACILHEIDHLDGKCISDHLSSIKRDILRRRYQKLEKKWKRAH